MGKVVWITGTTSLPPRRSNKSFAWGRRTACEQDNKQTKNYNIETSFLCAHTKNAIEPLLCLLKSTFLIKSWEMPSPDWPAEWQVVDVWLPRRAQFPRLSGRSLWGRWRHFSPWWAFAPEEQVYSQDTSTESAGGGQNIWANLFSGIVVFLLRKRIRARKKRKKNTTGRRFFKVDVKN